MRRYRSIRNWYIRKGTMGILLRLGSCISHPRPSHFHAQTHYPLAPPSLQTLTLRNGHFKSPVVDTVCLPSQPEVIQPDPIQVRIFLSVSDPYTHSVIARKQQRSSLPTPSQIVLITPLYFKSLLICDL